MSVRPVSLVRHGKYAVSVQSISAPGSPTQRHHLEEAYSLSCFRQYLTSSYEVWGSNGINLLRFSRRYPSPSVAPFAPSPGSDTTFVRTWGHRTLDRHIPKRETSQEGCHPRHSFSDARCTAPEVANPDHLGSAI
eukprot:1941239-Rhodomonas_salina.2